MKNKICAIIVYGIVALMFLLSVIIHGTTEWFDMRFGVSFEEILFTLTSPLNGSDVSFMDEAVEYVTPFVIEALLQLITSGLIILLLNIILIEFKVKVFHKTFCVTLCKLYQWACVIVVIAMLVDAVVYGVRTLGIDTYVAQRIDKTTIYEEYYVDPDTIELTNCDKSRNLFYIYLESMETTYASTDKGGSQEINYIPHLTELAEENISFSHTEKLGGASLTGGSTWTMGALLSTTSGVPFSLPVGCNSMNFFENFLPGLTTLGDILEERGYNQVFLCGSDGTFAGRQNYFEQHGNYNVVDYYDAIKKGYIDEDYYVWWGYEDLKLFDIAKTELLEISEKDEPFNFTMLTVDTHHIDGYVCENCEDTYGNNQLGNVLQCADNQIYDFLEWCKEQDFYDNTTIIVTGDHFRMDSSLIGEDAVRRVYNCYINAAKKPYGSTVNRTFTSLDFFPTTLSAMGFEIEGDRLGLGTDLFSETLTLAEELGLEYINEELAKHSSYYEKSFQ